MSELCTARLDLELVRRADMDRPLYHHQALVLDEWDQHQTFYVETKTGTGKTTAAMLPLLKGRTSAVAVYPTNELLRDQISSIQRLAEEEGLQVCVQTPDDDTGYACADLTLVPVDGDLLAQWCKKRNWQTKGKALQELLARDKPFKIILTNPDVLFLIFALRYRSEPLAAVLQYHALVVDEFHLYTGVELAHALLMADFGRRLGAFDKILLLSATPDPETRIYLDRLLQPRRVTLAERMQHPVAGRRTAVDRVHLVPVLVGRDVVDTAFEQIEARAGLIRKSRTSRPESRYLPALVVVNSVVDAIRLEDRLVSEGVFERGELAVIRGLSSRWVREMEGKHLAIGTSAVEVGIDFNCDLLIFEASEAASFLQRFGRVGRHGEGTAVILCPASVKEGLDGLGGEIDRGEFEEKVHAWYSQRAAYAWFATTYGGLVTTRALVEGILIKIREDVRADPSEVAASAGILNEHWRGYARCLGADEALIEQVQMHFAKMDRRPGFKWLRAYSDLNTFRTSLPSEWVHDFAEEERRGERGLAEYRVDIAALLRRAEGLRFNEKMWNTHVSPSKQGMLTVRGYGRWRRVAVLPTCDFVCDGTIERTDFSADIELHLVQDGNAHLTPVSHVMSLQPHVFVLLPKRLRSELDWRIPVFDCGDRLIAFDGAALLANEIHRKWETRA